MGAYSVEILADSVDVETRTRITTMRLCYPWCVHVEFLTHRLFASNSQSRRATKFENALADADFVPTFYGESEAGSPMNAGRNLPEGSASRTAVEVDWSDLRDASAAVAVMMRDCGVHRFFPGAVMANFGWMRTIITATAWENFYGLRDVDGVEPHLRKLAGMMRAAQAASVPTLRDHSWHLPGVSDDERRKWSFDECVSVSAARLARVSFLTDRAADVEADKRLGIRLVNDRHLSPFEHAAKPRPGRHGVFRNWLSARAVIAGECLPDRPYYGPTIHE